MIVGLYLEEELRVNEVERRLKVEFQGEGIIRKRYEEIISIWGIVKLSLVVVQVIWGTMVGEKSGEEVRM